MADEKKDQADRPAPSDATHTKPQETPPAQEWGERHETGKVHERGGKTTGPVPGATEQSR
jgi:hypothetical protein